MAVAAYSNGQYEWSEFQRDASHQHAHREPVAVDLPLR
jgi:hypothetical protein